jgi:hypothetical protein
MMFPDTSNSQQNAALRRAAERFRAAGNSHVVHEHDTRKPFAPMREEFNASRASGRERYASAPEERSFASR